MEALITQREGVDSHGIPLDVLESDYVRYFEQLHVNVWAVSNFRLEIGALFDSYLWDFMILTGGGSVPDQYYDVYGKCAEQSNRDRVERSLIKECLKRKIPILAICRGMQFLNGLFGGKISRLDHLNVERPIGKDHRVELLSAKRSIMVNSYHNDGIKKENLAIHFTPLAMDGENDVVEAFYSADMKIYGIQWHPEREFESVRGKEESRNLVNTFIKEYVSN